MQTGVYEELLTAALVITRPPEHCAHARQSENDEIGVFMQRKIKEQVTDRHDPRMDPWSVTRGCTLQASLNLHSSPHSSPVRRASPAAVMQTCALPCG